MSNPFAELRQLIDEAEKRVLARLETLEAERDYFKAENLRLWREEHERQDAETSERRRTGT